MEGSASPLPITIRSFEPCDLETCRRLYVEGLDGASIAQNDTGLDIDDIERAYMCDPGNHFWVAVNQGGEVVGMVGVQHHEEGVGEIRRLRVRQDVRRRGVGTALMEAAVRFCQERNYLKVALDTYMEREPAIRLFEKFRFRLCRTRTINDKVLMDFYLDLYTGEPRAKP